MSNQKVIIEISPSSLTSFHATAKSLLAAVFYGVCSVTIAFINKMLMSTLKFEYPVFIMAIQMMFTIFVLEVLSLAGIINLPRYTLTRGKNFAWPALFYGVNAVLALSALAHMNIAMYGVLKRCVPLSTMFLAIIILKKGFPTKMTVVAICLLSLGCVVAGYGDLSFNLKAYICGVLSNFTQALYLLLVQKSAEKDMTTVETLQLNSFNTLPILILAAVIKGEMSNVWAYNRFNDPFFLVIFFLAISMGCMLNYSLFLCTGLTSALTTSVVGGLKALAQTVLGLFTFGGVSHNLPTYIGIAMNFSGGVMYIYTKLKDTQSRKSEVRKGITSLAKLEKGSVANGYVGNGNIQHMVEHIRGEENHTAS